jgi:hypothetical protein
MFIIRIEDLLSQFQNGTVIEIFFADHTMSTRIQDVELPTNYST